MLTTPHHLYKTELNDRILWADGTSSYSPAKLIEKIVSGQLKGQAYVTEITTHVEQYNKLVDKEEQIDTKKDLKLEPIKTTIPLEYADVSVRKFVDQKFLNDVDANPDWSQKEIEQRYIRVKRELDLYYTLGLLDVLRTIIYIINMLTSKNIVWGVGRGSSASSYVLYLIGAHDVDSFKYELDINDFLSQEIK